MKEAEYFKPREYQIELFEKALRENVILFLPTGSGKTLIATMVIKHLSKDIEKKYSEGGKRTFFLVNTVALATQQSNYIKGQVPFNIGTYTGDLGVDLWDEKKWLKELEEHEILVMTAQIFLDMLLHSYITLSRVNVLIMDECHHAVNNHPMKQIMVLFDGIPESERPRVLGLTASLLNSSVKPHQIANEIHQLEITLHAKICRAKDETLIQKFSTNPIEEIIYFDECTDSLSTCHSIINMSMDNLKKIINGIYFENEQSVVNSDLQELIIEKKSERRRINNMLMEVKEVADDIGVLGASYALLARLFTIERLKIACPSQTLFHMYAMITTAIHKIRKILRVEMDKYSTSDVPFIFSSPKLVKLFEVLENYKKENTSIIFVNRRITAQVLYYVMKRLSQSNTKFEAINPDFIVGTNANPFNNTREPELVRKKNKETLMRFNCKETNVLFASDVIEEGIDIQHCNYVIKFDYPKTLCSYIQSKGRARYKDSKYIVFAPKNNIGKREFGLIHEEYRKSEKILKQELCYGMDERRKGGTEEEAKLFVYNHPVEPFYVNGPGSACATVTSSIALLNRYCSSLPSDKFTTLTVTYWKQTTPDGRFIVSLQLPMNCPLREVIKGEPCDSIDIAKGSAALEACKKLFALKELNEKLLPVGPEFEIDEEFVFPLWVDKDDESFNGNKSRPGTKKRQRIYDKKVPMWMCGCTPKPFAPTYIHLVRMSPNYDYPSSNRLRAFYDLLKTPKTFAFLSSNRWPKVCEFPLFMNVGEIKIKIEENYCVKEFYPYELKEIFDFHCLLVTEALPMKKKFLVKDLDDGKYSYYIAPVLEKFDCCDIDWETIKQHKNIPEPKLIPFDEREEIVVTKDKYYCKVVIPWYRPQNLMLRYIVTKVCEDETPLNPFPSDNFRSYEHYFSSRYNQKIANLNQPLLEVRAISQKTNCLIPRGPLRLGKRKKRDEEDLEEVLIPELCLLLEFPSVYLLKVTLLPSLVHRLSLLFLAEELRQKVASEIGLGNKILPEGFCWEPLRADEGAMSMADEQQSQPKSTIEVSNMLTSEMESLNPKECPWNKDDEPCDIERNLETVDLLSIIYYDNFARMKLDDKKSMEVEYFLSENVSVPEIPFLKPHHSFGPQLNQIAQVFIANGGNDMINYERLETLGDSFLKFMACLVLFTVFPDKDEGKLTNLKGKIVGNRNLFYCGRHIQLGAMLKVIPFSVEDWDVPHYKLLDAIRNLFKNLRFPPSLLFQLNLIDEERESSILSDKTLQQLCTILSNANDDVITPGALHALQQEVVADKNVADSVEALIGAYLKACGIEGGFKLCKWLQLIPPGWANIDDVLYKPAPTAQLNNLFVINNLLIMPEELENKLGYKFNDRSYLLQALSHSSFSQYATDCYQRLEFLGDSILDFLITCHIYDKCGNLGPGELTDLRSALVNNITFACLVIKYGFHKFILSKAVLLSNMINKFAQQQERRGHKIGAEVLLMVNEDDVKVGESIDVPKVLGDIFESLAGAVFLDSGKSLFTVWNVFYRLMHNEITAFSKNVPKNNIRLLFEKFPTPYPVFETVSCWDPNNPGILVSVTVIHHGEKKTFYGYGVNKASAKMAAAKVALRQCHSKEKEA